MRATGQELLAFGEILLPVSSWCFVDRAEQLQDGDELTSAAIADFQEILPFDIEGGNLDLHRRLQRFQHRRRRRCSGGIVQACHGDIRSP